MAAPTERKPPKQVGGKFVKQPVKEFLPGPDGGDPDKPDLFVFENSSDATKVSRSFPEETRVKNKKIDGRQRAVIEEKVVSGASSGISYDVWVDKPIESSSASEEPDVLSGEEADAVAAERLGGE